MNKNALLIMGLGIAGMLLLATNPIIPFIAGLSLFGLLHSMNNRAPTYSPHTYQRSHLPFPTSSHYQPAITRTYLPAQTGHQRRMSHKAPSRSPTIPHASTFYPVGSNVIHSNRRFRQF